MPAPLAYTLSAYIARKFSFSVLVMILFLTGLISLFDFIDLLRRVATKPDVPTSIVTEIACLHVPFFAMNILPFGILLGGIICFWQLTRSSELIVTRAGGISAWQFLSAPIFCAFMLGVFSTAILSPLSSVMYAQAERLDNTYLRTGGGGPGNLDLSGGELWVRQLDPQLTPHGVAILHARSVRTEKGVISLSKTSIFRLDEQDRLLARMESPSGRLEKGAWHFEKTHAIKPDQLPTYIGDMTLPTDLTVERIQDSFASPDTLSIWSLPGFIRLLDRSGFSSIRHRLHFQALLSLPFLSATMALVAAGFSMRPTRHGGVMRMIGSGVAVGFALFTVSKIAEQLGNSGVLPPILAAWAPTASGFCLALTLLLHLEDG